MRTFSKSNLLFLAIVSFAAKSVLANDVELDQWPYRLIYIENIEVSGNIKTKTNEVLRISGLKTGQELGRDRTIAAKKALLSAGLFEEVVLQVIPGSKVGKANIQIRVKEKTTWFVVPYFQYSKGNLGGGLAAGETNFLGLSKKALVGGSWSNKRKSVILGYRDPSILGSQFILGLDGIWRSDILTEYAEDTEVRRLRLREAGFTALPGYQWTPQFSTSIGIFFRSIKQQLKMQTNGARPLAMGGIRDGQDVAGVIRFDFNQMSTVEGLHDGITTELEVHLSDKRFNSDYEYSREIFRLTFAQRLGKAPQFGFVSSGSFQFGQRLPFYRELTIGGTNLRGYRSEQFRGDTRYSMNHEFIFPIYRFTRIILRGLVFWDSAIMYFESEGFERDAWRNGMGGGLRVYLKGINIPALGYDLGFGVEPGDFHHYLNIGAAF